MVSALLFELNKISGVQGSAIASRDGLVLAYSASSKLGEDLTGAVAAALFAVGKQGLAKLVGGNAKLVAVTGEQGHVLVTMPDDELLLITIAEANADVPTIFQHMSRFQNKFTAAAI